MKYTTTDNHTFRAGIGYVPKPWIECNSDISYENIVYNHFSKHIRAYDADECGNETHDFLFSDGKAFRLEYSWWIDWHNEDPELNGFQDEYTITPISPNEANVPTKTERDYI